MRRSTWTGGFTLLTLLVLPSLAEAAYTRVVIVGTLQKDMGCVANDNATYAASELVFDANDQVWQKSVSLPAGNYTYRVVAQDSVAGTSTTFGRRGVVNGTAINVTGPVQLKFYFEPASGGVLDTQNDVIAVAPGDFQSELGCSGDWMPDCLRSLPLDPDGDGTYERRFSLPAGSYQGKVAISESWNESYPGNNVSLTTAAATQTVIARYVAATHAVSFVVMSPSSCQLDTIASPTAGATFPWKLSVDGGTFGVPSGQAQLFVDDAGVATKALDDGGVAASTASIATAGTHVVRAEYGGDTAFLGCVTDQTIKVLEPPIDAGPDASVADAGTTPAPGPTTTPTPPKPTTSDAGASDASSSSDSGGGCSVAAPGGSFVGIAAGAVFAVAFARRRAKRR